MWGKIILLFCIFAAQGTPVFYAQGIRIPYRLMNIIYFSYFTFGLLIWIVMLKEIKQSKAIKIFVDKYKMSDSIRQKYYKKIYYGMLSFMLFVSIIGNIKIQENETEKGKIEIKGLPITAEAIYSLITGEAKRYSDEANKRVELYENEKAKKIKVKPFENYPYLLYHSDITTDKKHWRNQHISKYYNKKYIVLIPENKIE